MSTDPTVEDGGTGRDYSRLAPTVFERVRMQRLSVLVVGAGALGNEVIKNLALLGAGSITIVDRDTIEASNLTRSVLFCTPDIDWHIQAATPKAAFAALRVVQMNPDVRSTAIHGDFAAVGLGLVRRSDLVFSCVDNEMARLEIGWACTRMDRPLVDGGLGLLNYSSGEVCVFPGADGPCYACRKGTDRRRQLLQEMQSREDPCWLKQAAADAAGTVTTTPLMASAVAAMQVEMGLRLAFEGSPDSATGMAFRLTLHPGPTLETSRFQRSASCPLHEPGSVARQVHEASTLHSETCSATHLFAEVGMSDATLRLDWPLTVLASCSRCSHEWEPLVRRAAFRASVCPACGSRELVERRVITSISSGTALADRPLASLGLPAAHVWEVVPTGSGMPVHAEMTGDLAATGVSPGART